MCLFGCLGVDVFVWRGCWEFVCLFVGVFCFIFWIVFHHTIYLMENYLTQWETHNFLNKQVNISPLNSV